jgi:hypothetical protein
LCTQVVEQVLLFATDPDSGSPVSAPVSHWLILSSVLVLTSTLLF